VSYYYELDQSDSPGVVVWGKLWKSWDSGARRSIKGKPWIQTETSLNGLELCSLLTLTTCQVWSSIYKILLLSVSGCKDNSEHLSSQNDPRKPERQRPREGSEGQGQAGQFSSPQPSHRSHSKMSIYKFSLDVEHSC
jgi:hypothetical protein